jgi:hypothetical protein
MTRFMNLFETVDESPVSVDTKQMDTDRVDQLKAAADLIEQAIIHEDGKASTMAEIRDLLTKEHHRLGDGEGTIIFKTSPLTKGIKLSAEMRETYLKLLSTLKVEIAKLTGEPTTRAHALGDAFKRQRAHLKQLRASVEAQPFWKSSRLADRSKRMKVNQMFREIENKLEHREMILPALIKKLEAEAGVEDQRMVLGFTIRFRNNALRDSKEFAVPVSKADSADSAVEVAKKSPMVRDWLRKDYVVDGTTTHFA